MTEQSPTPQLFDYQREGAQWLTSKKFAYLADEMGLGKSAQAITAADCVRANTILVLCPASARVNWTREFAKFSTRPRSITPVLTEYDAPQAMSDVVVSSYELAPLLPVRQWDLVLPDEAHYLKSVDASRARAVLGSDGLVHRAHACWFLSGTPAPNNPAELWTVLYVTGVTKLSYDAFVARYCKGWHSPYGFQITGGQNLDELRALMRPFLLRRKKEQVLKDMPPILFSELTVEPGPVDLEARFFTQWQAGGNAGVLNRVQNEYVVLRDKAGRDFAALEQIAESVSMLRRYVGLQKVQPVVDMVAAELRAGAYDKIVLFAVHRDVVESLRQGLRDFHPLILYGGTPAEERQRRVDHFQHRGKHKVFIGNIQAAGTSLTLTAAHQVLFVEASWVPSENAQAAARCHRIGQTKAVNVRFVSVAGSIDESVNRVLARKTRTIAALFD